MLANKGYKVNGHNTRRTRGIMGNKTRAMAFRLILVFFFGTLIGSLLPESGNVMAYILEPPGYQTHAFNGLFFIIGVLGIGLACHIGRSNSI